MMNKPKTSCPDVSRFAAVVEWARQNNLQIGELAVGDVRMVFQDLEVGGVEELDLTRREEDPDLQGWDDPELDNLEATMAYGKKFGVFDESDLPDVDAGHPRKRS